MPNIMLTSKCNLHCSYCFADNLVNQNNTADITIENFQTAVNFLTSNGKVRIGLIGGEPSLHHDLKSILDIVIRDPLVETITFCTNGIALESHMDLLDNPKIQILFNCNTAPNITPTQEHRMLTNIDRYFSKTSNIGTLGINIYNNDIDCTYIFELAKKYHQDVIRMSLTIPTLEVCNKLSYFEYFKLRKSKLLELIDLANKYNVQFSFDCDIPPMCELCMDSRIPPNLNSTAKGCSPIIDITTNLEAIRCFGTSHLCKVKITDFPDLNALRKYFIENIDKPAADIIVKNRCKDCLKRKNLECFSGCIRFKTNSFNI